MLHPVCWDNRFSRISGVFPIAPTNPDTGGLAKMAARKTCVLAISQHNITSQYRDISEIWQRWQIYLRSLRIVERKWRVQAVSEKWRLWRSTSRDHSFNLDWFSLPLMAVNNAGGLRHWEMSLTKLQTVLLFITLSLTNVIAEKRPRGVAKSSIQFFVEVNWRNRSTFICSCRGRNVAMSR